MSWQHHRYFLVTSPLRSLRCSSTASARLPLTASIAESSAHPHNNVSSLSRFQSLPVRDLSVHTSGIGALTPFDAHHDSWVSMTRSFSPILSASLCFAPFGQHALDAPYRRGRRLVRSLALQDIFCPVAAAILVPPHASPIERSIVCITQTICIHVRRWLGVRFRCSGTFLRQYHSP